MQIIYAYIFYFILVMIALTVGLLVFALPSARRILYNFRRKNRNLFENQIIQYALYFSFAIIGLILLESVYTFSTLKTHFNEHNSGVHNTNWERYDLVKASNSESYLQMLKEYREYYMAERNIMLSSSALFIYFVFARLMFNINKLSEIENGEKDQNAEPKEEAGEDKKLKAQ